MSTKIQFHRRLIALLSVCSFLVCWSPSADAADELDQLSVSLGAYDTVRHKNDSGHVSLEYRMPRFDFLHLKPWAGLLSTSDRAFWGGAGVYFDWAVSSKWRVTPSFGAGFYEDGIGLDLGHTLEFRSQLELAYRFRSHGRIGFNFGHFSNAGIADSNKGTEYVNVSYTLPLTRRRTGAPIHTAKTGSTPRTAAELE
jgi:lipid A 3-O-deacylase